MVNKKPVFGKAFSREKLLCLGCGKSFVSFPMYGEQSCPFCLCVHFLSVVGVVGWGSMMLRDRVKETHVMWSKFGIRGECSAGVVFSRMVKFLKEVKE